MSPVQLSGGVKTLILIHKDSDMTICLPESFEWLILKSGLVQAGNMEEVLEVRCV